MIATLDMIAAPALEPAISPPRACRRRIAASTGVSRPFGASARSRVDWSPPVK